MATSEHFHETFELKFKLMIISASSADIQLYKWIEKGNNATSVLYPLHGVIHVRTPCTAWSTCAPPARCDPRAHPLHGVIHVRTPCTAWSTCAPPARCDPRAHPLHGVIHVRTPCTVWSTCAPPARCDPRAHPLHGVIHVRTPCTAWSTCAPPARCDPRAHPLHGVIHVRTPCTAWSTCAPPARCDPTNKVFRNDGNKLLSRVVVKCITIGSGGRGFDSRAGQIERSVASDSPPLWRFFRAVLSRRKTSILKIWFLFLHLRSSSNNVITDLHPLGGVVSMTRLSEQGTILHIFTQTLNETEWFVEDDRHRYLGQFLKPECLKLMNRLGN